MNNFRLTSGWRTQHRFAAMIAAALFPLFAQPAYALTLDLIPATASANTFEMGVTVLLASDTDTTTGAGSIEVALPYSVVDGAAVINEIEFTGGQIDFIGIDFTIGVLSISGTGVAGTPETTAIPSLVQGGLYDAAEHQLTVNQGAFTQNGVPVFDLTETPFGGPGSGDGSVALSETDRSGGTVTYDVTVTFPIAFTGVVGEGLFAADVDLSGNIVASGEWVVSIATPGDFNADGSVDAADYTVWRDNFGATDESALNGAGDNSGAVDQGDYTLWNASYGQDGAPAAASPAPEPATLWLSAALLAVIGCRTRLAA